jgi:hypothetical protein
MKLCRRVDYKYSLELYMKYSLLVNSYKHGQASSFKCIPVVVQQ